MEEYHAEDSRNLFRSSKFGDIIIAIGIAVKDELCQSFIGALLCFFEFPACDLNTSEELPICLVRCLEIQAAYQHCFQGQNLAIVNPKRDPTIGNITENFNCLAPETYYFSDDGVLNISNTSCSKFMNYCLLYMCVHCTHENISTDKKDS